MEIAIKQMRREEAIEEDGMVVEMVEGLGAGCLEVEVQFTNNINDTGVIPTPMQLSTFITLPKKPRAMMCNKYRAIRIMSQLGEQKSKSRNTGGRIWIC